MAQKKQYIIIIFIAFTVGLAKAQTIYVDNQLEYNCYGNYSVANRDSSGFDGIALKTLDEAAMLAIEGTSVLIREGMYNEQFIPQHSGTPDKSIVFRNYMNENVVISGNELSPAIFIDQKDYIIIDGIVVKNVRRWLNALGCNNLIIRNCTFKNANDPGGSSKTGIFFHGCNYCKIQNNTLDSTTQDNLIMVDSDFNVVEGNAFTRAKHVLWTLKCSSYNVLRSNYFHNAFQKIGEIYDCDEVGFGNKDFPKITSVDDTKFNVIEDNTFAYTSTPKNRSPYAGIQFAGQNCIVRKNIFYNCYGPPIGITVYPGEAEYNYNNTIYNNVFFNNHFGGISVSSSSSVNCYGHQVVNNIFFRNNFEQHDFRWKWYDGLDGKPVQVFIGRTDKVSFRNNNIFNENAGESWLIAYGTRTSEPNSEPQPVSWWENNYPELFEGTLEVNPDFENTTDFHLSPSSPMIDVGAFLSHTIGSASNSTEMVLDNVSFFIDGFGIVEGDIIQLEGQNLTAKIKDINYHTKTLSLSDPLSWHDRQGVSLKYKGKAPDIGAVEQKE